MHNDWKPRLHNSLQKGYDPMTKWTTHPRGERALHVLAALLCAGSLAFPALGQVSSSKYAEYDNIDGAEKVSLRLLSMAEKAAKSNDGMRPLPGPTNLLLPGPGGGLLVDIVADGLSPSLIDELERTGASVVYTAPQWRRAVVEISSPQTIQQLAAIDGVNMVRESLGYRKSTGSVEGQADAALRSDLASSKYDLDGSNLVVGILSDSFARTDAVLDLGGEPPTEFLDDGVVINTRNQKSGDLPNSPVIPKDGDPWEPYVQIILDAPSGIDEGAAMAELVHDIAPRAAISFHTAVTSEIGFAQAIQTLAARDSGNSDLLVGEADVIVDDIIFLAEPMYQDGPVAQSAADVVSRGIPYFSAAGNNGNYGLRQIYNDSNPADGDGTLPPNGNDLHRWHNGSEFLPITLAPGRMFTAILQWNQPFQSVSGGRAAQIDLDFYVTLEPNASSIEDSLFNPTAGPFLFSKEGQGRTGLPAGDAIEAVQYVNDTDQTQTVYLAIDHFWGNQENIPQATDTPLEFRIVFFDITDGVTIDGLDPNDSTTGGPTIYGHAVAPGAVAVGAVNWFDTPSFSPTFGSTNEIDPETFTARGGETTIFFDTSGLPVPRTSFEPDIAAVDGNNTTFFGSGDFDLDGSPNFFGTSAAAPNAAAVAALLLDLNNFLTPGQITSAMVSTAIDVKGQRAAPGVDDVSGAGLLDALAAADFVVNNFGAGNGPSAPNSHLFSNAEDWDDWEFESSEPFDAPIAGQSGGSIDLTAQDNVNVFGWYRSPEFIASAVLVGQGDEGPLEVNGLRGPNSLFRTTFRVSSDAETGLEAPDFRMRTMTSNREQSDVFAATSTGNGSLMPDENGMKTYRHYFTIPETDSRFTLFFDMLNLDGTNASNVSYGLEEVLVEGFPTGTGSLTDQTQEALLFFWQGDHGWSKRGGGPLGDVQASHSLEDGLVLGPAMDPSTTSFGFWGSPEGAPLAMLEQNRLYRATFRVRSDAPADRMTDIPTFRCRVNDSSLQMSAYLDINSTSPAANFPSAGETIDYTLYFEAPQALLGNGVNFSFDYLYIPGIGKDPNLTVELEGFRLDSFERPVAP